MDINLERVKVLIEYVRKIQGIVDQEGYGAESEFPWGAYYKVIDIKAETKKMVASIELLHLEEEIELREEKDREELAKYK